MVHGSPVVVVPAGFSTDCSNRARVLGFAAGRAAGGNALLVGQGVVSE